MIADLSQWSKTKSDLVTQKKSSFKKGEKIKRIPWCFKTKICICPNYKWKNLNFVNLREKLCKDVYIASSGQYWCNSKNWENKDKIFKPCYNSKICFEPRVIALNLVSKENADDGRKIVLTPKNIHEGTSPSDSEHREVSHHGGAQMLCYNCLTIYRSDIR